MPPIFSNFNSILPLYLTISQDSRIIFFDKKIAIEIRYMSIDLSISAVLLSFLLTFPTLLSWVVGGHVNKVVVRRGSTLCNLKWVL